ncbi:MAG TPA: PDZ domain-containing protein [Verrucomicrobiae bacterium]|nr:PDZ domain-containing protein [Verrucomicrobiae bacterium]
MYFSIDTGFTRSAVDSRYAPLLGKAISTCTAEGPLGAMEGVPVYSAPEISVGGRQLELKTILATDLQMSRWVSGEPCDGVIGIDGLSNLVVSLNFSRKTIALQKSVPENIDRDFISVSLKNRDASFLLPIRVNGVGLTELVIDTGDSSSISFDVADWNEIFVRPSMHQSTTTLAGIGEQVATSKIGVVPSISLQSLNYTNLHATFIRNPAESSHIGLGFFRRHDVIFDFPNRTLYLKPNENFSVPDEEDMSGLHLLRHQGSTIVYSVDEGSPAFKQGIRSRDNIVSVNGQDSSNLTMDSIRRILRAGDGQQVALQVKRGTSVLGFRIALKKAL